MFTTLTYSYFVLCLFCSVLFATTFLFHYQHCSTFFLFYLFFWSVLTMSIYVRQNLFLFDFDKVNNFHWNDHWNNDINFMLVLVFLICWGHLQWWLWFTCQNEHKIMHMLTILLLPLFLLHCFDYYKLLRKCSTLHSVS